MLDRQGSYIGRDSHHVGPTWKVSKGLIARLLDQIYVVQPPMFPLRYDDALPQEYEYSQPHTSTDGTRPSAPQFPEHLHSLLTCS